MPTQRHTCQSHTIQTHIQSFGKSAATAPRGQSSKSLQ